MTSNVLRYGCFLTLLFFSHTNVAQQLDLDSFIQSILKNNPGVQKILSEKAIAAGELQASKGVDDAVLSSSLNLSHTEPNPLLGIEAKDSDDARLNLSYDRLFSDYGTRFSMAYSNQYTDRNPALSSLGSEYYQPSMTLRLTQPLLKNAGGIQDNLNIKLSQLNLKLTKLSTIENLESYITQLATLYIDWYLAARELDISKEVHQQAIEQEKLTRTKVQRQVIEPYELLRAQETREDYYSRWQQARGRFIGLARQIQHQMNLSNKLEADKLTPTNPKNSKLLTTRQDINTKADYLTTTSRLKELLDTLQAQQIILLGARGNSREADLDLSFGYTRHGVDDGFNDAHTSNLDRDDYSVMLEYRKPFGNRQAKGKYQAQLASQRQVKADTKQRLIDAESSLANLQIQESQLVIALKSIDRKIDLAEQKIKKEQRLYKIGKLDLFELLRDQTTQLESRLNRENLYTQLLTLRLKIGELLDNNLDTYIINSDSETDFTVDTATGE
ncbi:MAG: TolC family protein [Gammaproteobacteria bacterium]|nr:TolC family protein [Gammaproteobacteria bacterium]